LISAYSLTQFNITNLSQVYSVPVPYMFQLAEFNGAWITISAKQMCCHFTHHNSPVPHTVSRTRGD